MRLAIERGELNGTCNGWETFRSLWKESIESGDLTIVLQALPKPHADLPKVPLVISYAKSEAARQLIQLGIHDVSAIARPFVLPPGTAKDRVQLFRQAFWATVSDAGFLADAEKSNLDISPLSGEELEKTVHGLVKTNSDVTRLGSTTHFYVRSAFKHLGMDADKDMTLLQLGAGPEIAIALQTGQIAAAVLSYRNALSFLEQEWPVMVNLTQTGFKYPPSCVASSRAFIGKNPNTVDGFLKAYGEAIHTIKKDLNLAKRVYAKYYRESDPAITDKVVRAYADLFKPIPNVPEEGIEGGRAPRFRLPTTAAQRPVKDQPL